VAEGIRRVYSRGGRSAAAVVIDNQSGDVLALVGAALPDNPLWGEFNAATAVRQPGSALKPFVYAAALEQGMTAATLAADIERPFPDTWGIYSPENYDGAFHGPVRLRDALAQSLNVAAVDVLSRTGLGNAFGLLDRAGLKTLDRRPSYFGLGLTLGSGGVRLIDLANAYAALARGGVALPWQILVEAESDGVVRAAPVADGERILDERIAFIIADILADPEARVPQFGERSILQTPYWTAVKTGTSKGYRDNWTVGFTRRFTAGVWVGDPAGRPMHRMSGAQGAGRMWRKIMNAVTEHRSRRPAAPAGLERARVCAISGERVGPHCPGGVDEWFLAGTAPQERCDFHRRTPVDPENGLLVPDGCDLPDAELRTVTVFPSPFDAWAVRAEVGQPEAYTPRCRPPVPPGRARLRLLSPAPSEMIRIDGDVPRRAQALLLHAALEDAVGPVTFLVDGEPLATVEAPHRTYWPVEPGRHAITVRHDRSHTESAVHWVEVY
jgi:penicillin-binding protein 1C